MRAWHTTCGHKIEDLMPLITWRREVLKGNVKQLKGWNKNGIAWGTACGHTIKDSRPLIIWKRGVERQWSTTERMRWSYRAWGTACGQFESRPQVKMQVGLTVWKVGEKIHLQALYVCSINMYAAEVSIKFELPRAQPCGFALCT